eukprot:774710-Pelagomonas_calceolata.AAC.1
MEALQIGQPLHAREFVRRQYKIQIRWSKRTQTTPVAQSVWDKYLKAHFQPREEAQLVRGGVALSARDIAVPLDRGRDIEACLETGYSK